MFLKREREAAEHISSGSAGVHRSQFCEIQETGELKIVTDKSFMCSPVHAYQLEALHKYLLYGSKEEDMGWEGKGNNIQEGKAKPYIIP